MRQARRPGRDRPARDAGETLIELMVTVLIVSITMIALVGAVGVSARMSELNSTKAAVSAHLHAFAEALSSYVDADPTNYTPCATAAAYAPAYTSPEPAYVATIAAIDYWNGTSFGTGCLPATDSGIQRVTLRVVSANGEAAESLEVVIRKPCRPSPDYTDPAC